MVTTFELMSPSTAEPIYSAGHAIVTIAFDLDQ